MGASYRPENPFAEQPQGSYRPENPYAKKPRDLSGIREAEALGYAPPVRPDSPRSFKGIQLGSTAPTIGSQTAKASGQPEGVNPLLGAASKAVHGATLGGSDELAGLLSGAVAPFRGENPVDAYRETADVVRGVNRGFSAEHPIAAAVSELAGAVGGGMGAQSLLRLGKAAPALANPAFKADLIRKVLEGTAIGAGAGAASGVLGSEGEERLSGGVEGGGLGAAGGLVFGAAAPLVGEVLSPVARPLATKFSRRSNKELAQMQLIRSITRGGNTPKGILAQADETPEVPRAIVDASENTRALGRVAQSYPGAAKDVISRNLSDRVRQEPTVGKTLVSKALRMEPEDIGLKAEELVARTKANAAPLYQKAYAHGVIDDPAINTILDLPDFARAYARARRLAKLDGVELPSIYRTVERPSKILGPDGKPRMVKVQERVAAPDVRTLDYMKRGMDAHIEGKMRRGAMDRTEARALRRKMNDVLDVVDKKVPDYAKARAQFRGDKEAERALEEGRNFWKTDVAVIERRLGKMTPEEQKLYRAAALDQVMRRLSGTTRGRNAVARINRNEDDAARLRALVGNDTDFKQLMKGLDALEETHATSNKVLQNSITQRLKVEQQDFEGDPAQAALSMLTQGPIKTAANAVGNRLAAWQKGVTEGTAEELGPMLTATGPAMKQTVVELEDLVPRLAREQAQRTARRRAVVAGGASTAAPEKRKQHER